MKSIAWKISGNITQKKPSSDGLNIFSRNICPTAQPEN